MTATFRRAETDPVAEADLAALEAALEGELATKLPLAGGSMTGALELAADPAAPLEAATRQYVVGQIAALVNGAPSTLDTLNEIAAQLGNDESAVAALTATVAGKLSSAANLGDLANVVTARANLGTDAAGTARPPTAHKASHATGGGDALVATDVGAIPSSIVDGKGDVLIATADNTIVRKAVGANGRALVADSSKADGASWIPPMGSRLPYMISGAWYGHPAGGEAAGGSFALNTLFLSPFWLPVRTTFDQIGINVFTAASAGVVFRTAVYADNGVAGPDALLLDVFAPLVDAVGRKNTAINLTLDAGVYWLGGGTQNAGAARGNISRVAGSTYFGMPSGQNGNFTTAMRGFTRAVAAGAWPANLNPVRADLENSSDYPFVWLRVA